MSVPPCVCSVTNTYYYLPQAMYRDVHHFATVHRDLTHSLLVLPLFNLQLWYSYVITNARCGAMVALAGHDLPLFDSCVATVFPLCGRYRFIAWPLLDHIHVASVISDVCQAWPLNTTSLALLYHEFATSWPLFGP